MRCDKKKCVRTFAVLWGLGEEEEELLDGAEEVLELPGDFLSFAAYGYYQILTALSVILLYN